MNVNGQYGRDCLYCGEPTHFLDLDAAGVVRHHLDADIENNHDVDCDELGNSLVFRQKGHP